MNKYIYKVRFVTLNVYTTKTKIMHKHALFFGKIQRFQQQKKQIANKKYEWFMSILTKTLFFNFGSLTSGTHPPHFFYVGRLLKNKKNKKKNK